MDGLDPEPARCLQHAREQAARSLTHFRSDILAQGIELGSQIGILEPDPGCQSLADAIGHFRRPGFGKGQAQDRFGPHAAEQQSEHPRGQHLSLSRPGRGGHRGMRRRIDRAPLFAFEHGQGFQATRHKSP